MDQTLAILFWTVFHSILHRIIFLKIGILSKLKRINNTKGNIKNNYKIIDKRKRIKILNKITLNPQKIIKKKQNFKIFKITHKITQILNKN